MHFISAGPALDSNAIDTVTIHDVGGCFQSTDRIWVSDWDVRIPSIDVITEEDVIWEAFVYKDTRVARVSQQSRVSAFIYEMFIDREAMEINVLDSVCLSVCPTSHG